MSWSDRYIGLPWSDFGRTRAGCDCWGLAVVVYREELGISLPDYLGYGSVDEHREIAALIAGAEASPLWQPVAGTPAPFDVAVFRRGRWDSHLGLIVRPGLMLHMEGEDCAKLADYRSGCWSNRLRGVFRHVSQSAETSLETGLKQPFKAEFGECRS